MTALKVLKLIDDDGRPAPVLERLVTSEGDERRAVLRSLLERHYGPIFALDLERATKAQFSEAFKVFGGREGVLRKCENFFIHAAQDAGVELSQYVLARRHSSRRPSTQARGRTAPVQPSAAVPVTAARSPGHSIAEMILAKYPDFDPMWDSAVQERWLEGIAKLYDRLGGEPGLMDQESSPDPAGG
jgi:hypothetical protein